MSAHSLRLVGEAEEGYCYAIIEICSLQRSASPERLTNEKAGWVT